MYLKPINIRLLSTTFVVYFILVYISFFYVEFYMKSYDSFVPLFISISIILVYFLKIGPHVLD